MLVYHSDDTDVVHAVHLRALKSAYRGWWTAFRRLCRREKRTVNEFLADSPHCHIVEAFLNTQKAYGNYLEAMGKACVGLSKKVLHKEVETAPPAPRLMPDMDAAALSTLDEKAGPIPEWDSFVLKDFISECKDPEKNFPEVVVKLGTQKISHLGGRFIASLVKPACERAAFKRELNPSLHGICMDFVNLVCDFHHHEELYIPIFVQHRSKMHRMGYDRLSIFALHKDLVKVFTQVDPGIAWSTVYPSQLIGLLDAPKFGAPEVAREIPFDMVSFVDQLTAEIEAQPRSGAFAASGKGRKKKSSS